MIVITGVSRGLGHALTHKLAAEGRTIVGCSRNQKAIDRLSQSLCPPHQFAAVDVADDAAVGAWAPGVLAEFGPPELLVNNAAIINKNAELWNVPPDEFSRLVDINIKGAYHVIRHFVPAMIAAGRGIIVNFSSTWGRTTSPQEAPYCASKWAIEGLTRALAQELPRGMAAVALNPGVIDTDMLRTCFGEAAAGYPSAEDWAKRAAPFLLQLTAKHNGQSLSVPT